MNSFVFYVFLIAVIDVNIGNIFDIYTNNNDSNTIFCIIFVLFYRIMNKLLLIALFFGILISSEVAMTALTMKMFDVCIIDMATDAEGEKDSKEKSEKDGKVEILLGSTIEDQALLLKSLLKPEISISSKPYLDEATPPPEV